MFGELIEKANKILKDAEEIDKLWWDSGDCDLIKVFHQKMREYAKVISELARKGYQLEPTLDRIEIEIQSLSGATDENSFGRLARLLCQREIIKEVFASAADAKTAGVHFLPKSTPRQLELFRIV